MEKCLPKITYLKDYKSPSFEISEVFLTVHLHDTETLVQSRLLVRKLKKSTNLFLHGKHLHLQSLVVNGSPLGVHEYELRGEGLEIKDVPETMVVETEVIINPQDNKSLYGLYKSGDIFCTQCEPEAFRKITFFLDRPDVMSTFKTKIIADKKRYPILLSNGNPILSGNEKGGKHFVVWEDPFKKPSYLYALVAGDLALIQDSFTTKSARSIDLRIYVDKGNEHLCSHAIKSLKKAMAWDEGRFNLEYDLNTYMIVAVDSFTMGAMENKGLNIFNSACILADPKMATDRDFLNIENIIGHEYFHNWTGNRVTCRDWFQLTLKEGLTVFRDQEFSSDMNSRSVKRIEDVLRLKLNQFPEDQGPMSHPIRPDHYIEINNFYTSTVYEKGAEVIRMIHTILGEEGFQRGMRRYFDLYDGMGVTTDDFIKAMRCVNNNFEQFKRWYEQSGTPEVSVHSSYDSKKHLLTIQLRQFCRETPGRKLPFHFPLAIGLIGRDGKDIPLVLKESTSDKPFVREGILNIREERERFTFEKVTSKPVLSFNRGLTAPIIVHGSMAMEDWCHLLAYDSDEFNRYEASQALGKMVVDSLLEQIHGNGEGDYSVREVYFEAYEVLLKEKNLDNSVKALCLTLPPEKILHQGQCIDIEGIFKAKKVLKRKLCRKFKVLWEDIYEKNAMDDPHKVDRNSMGKRAIRNCALSFLSELCSQESFALLYDQFQNSSNMTDQLASLSLLCHFECEERKKALEEFFHRWKNHTLVMQKWLSVQARSELPGTLDEVKKLEESSVYDKGVPNLFYSLIGSFSSNFIHFHHESGEGYDFIARQVVERDGETPQVASSLSRAFEDFKKLTKAKQKLMQPHLEHILNTDNLSKNTFEIIEKILMIP